MTLASPTTSLWKEPTYKYWCHTAADAELCERVQDAGGERFGSAKLAAHVRMGFLLADTQSTAI